MKVKELINKLNKVENKEQEVIIRFCLDSEDEIGYYLEPCFIDNLFNEVAIYGEYTATKEDCDFIGQVDLKEVYKRYKLEG